MSNALRPWLAVILLAGLGAALWVSSPALARAEEGMWTFDNPPVKQLQQKYGFTPTPAWLDHVRLSSIRFNDGGSGSFVSPHGLVLTNHHVALGQLQKVSTPQKDYAKDGFYARTEAEELKCPDLELNVLMSMEKVTTRVLGVLKPGMTDRQSFDARRAAIARIEKQSLDSTGLRSEVVPLYQGGEYWLYRYKKYTDIRLVFAPEEQIAFFGGDPDNFTYPRYDVDFALFRVYENGKPVESKNYLKWNTQGAADGDLVFVSGNPGNTSRLDTLAQIEFERDFVVPLVLQVIRRRIETARQYGALGPEQSREAYNPIFFLENGLKAETGYENGLRDPAVMDKKRKEEQEFRAQVDANPQWKAAYGGAWEEIAAAVNKHQSRWKQDLLRSVRASTMAERALTIVQYVAEVKKPDGKRLEGFHDSELDSLRFRLFSPAPAYPNLEKVLLASALEQSLEELGPDDPFIKAALGGQTPREAVDGYFNGTRLADPAFRKSLVEGGEAAVAASTDPMIVLARNIDPSVREIRKWVDDNVDSVETAAGEKIGKARFAVYGKSTYPDATFTLRLSYGTVKGYPMNGTLAPPKTTLYGLYDRSDSFNGHPPFDLPPRWVERRDRLDLATPVDFVSTCDIIGGNSGSPVIDRHGDLVGLIFDGNIESLAGDYVYDDEKNRAVAVHPAVIIEALRKIYDAAPLADELEGK